MYVAQQRVGRFGPTVEGTMVALISVVIAYLMIGQMETVALVPTQESPITDGLRLISLVLLVGIAGSAVMDMRYGWANLVRIDLACIGAFYFLVFFEFVFPQDRFELMVSSDEATMGVLLSLIGLTGLLIGRHMGGTTARSGFIPEIPEIPHFYYVRIFWFAAFIGFLHMLLAVNFNIFEMVEQMMRPRFTQPWIRGKYGSWSSLITELSLFLYLVPPIGAYLLINKSIGKFHKTLVGTVIIITVLSGFFSGTRNIFAAYFLLFIASYLMLQPRVTLRKVVVVGVISGGLFFYASDHMLKFRTIGFTRYWNEDLFVEESQKNYSVMNESYFVDYNLFAICKLSSVFPDRYDFMGWELYQWALVKPIPRAIWSGKPEGLSISIEEAMGAQGLTISATFVGESYIAYGKTGVFITGILFGAFCGYWNRIRKRSNSIFTMIMYGSAIFPAILGMRSLIWFTTALLPTIALVAFLVLFKDKLRSYYNRRRRMMMP